MSIQWTQLVQGLGINSAVKSLYPSCMPFKRTNLQTSVAFVEIVKRLMVKFGLNKTATIVHCVMRVAEQEGITKDGVLVKNKPSRSHQES